MHFDAPFVRDGELHVAYDIVRPYGASFAADHAEAAHVRQAAVTSAMVHEALRLDGPPHTHGSPALEGPQVVGLVCSGGRGLPRPQMDYRSRLSCFPTDQNPNTAPKNRDVEPPTLPAVVAKHFPSEAS